MRETRQNPKVLILGGGYAGMIAAARIAREAQAGPSSCSASACTRSSPAAGRRRWATRRSWGIRRSSWRATRRRPARRARSRSAWAASAPFPAAPTRERTWPASCAARSPSPSPWPLAAGAAGARSRRSGSRGALRAGGRPVLCLPAAPGTIVTRWNARSSCCANRSISATARSQAFSARPRPPAARSSGGRASAWQRAAPRRLRRRPRSTSACCKVFCATRAAGTFRAWEIRLARVNGRPGALSFFNGGLLSVVSLEVEDGRIQRLYFVLNPDKLPRLG